MKIAILGAGLSGLTLAHHLHTAADIHMFEKARGVGGRMATRYADPYQFDHGAQYFRVDHPDFQQFIREMSAAGVMTTWATDFYTWQDSAPIPFELDSPAYVPVGKMNALCQYLSRQMADHISLNLSCQIKGIAPAPQNHKKWIVTDQHDQTYGPFDYIVSTLPEPQMRALFTPFLTQSDHRLFDHVEMQGCFSLMIGDQDLKIKTGLPAKINGSPIGWMAYNHQKPNRHTAPIFAPSLIIQSTNDWAEDHMDDDQDWVKTTLIQAASEILGQDLSNADHRVLHRWRYANVTASLGQPFWSGETQGLAACGDWCLGGKVEKAYLSGFTLAEHLKGITGV